MRRMILLFLWVACSGFAAAAEPLPPAANGEVDFVRDIQPIFKARCYACHDGGKQRGGLRLDMKTAALKGGESYAPAIVPGKSADSPLVRFVAGLEDGMLMPPEGDSLSAAQIGLLRAWIDQGAKWPDSASAADDAQSHWSFRPVKRPSVPEASSWTRNQIDPFIARELQNQNQLTPSPEADRVTLIRRLSFDLLGLPPDPEDVAEFASDERPDAFERLVDRLLASPHFGERWARHWLDVVRFAESDGFETNQPRPNAWPYRDYVIRAFNEDKPYAQFVTEQLAGDSLGVDEATGFIVGGAWDRVKSPDPGLTAQQRADELHDMVSTTGSAFLGLTVGCARCHNHKFDPISQVDYYSMKAVFAGVQHGDRPIKPPDFPERERQIAQIKRELAEIEVALRGFEPLAFVGTGNCLQEAVGGAPAKSGTGAAGPGPRLRPSVHAKTNTDRFAPITAKVVRFVVEQTNNGAQPCIDELEVFTTGAQPQNVARQAIATSSSNLPGYEIHQLKHVNDGRYGNSASWISNEAGAGWVQLEFPQAVEIDRVVWSRDRTEPGQFVDRVPTKYRIEAGLAVDSLTCVATSRDRLPTDGNRTAMSAVAALPEFEQPIAVELASRRESLQSTLRRLGEMRQVYAGRFVSPEPTFRFHRGDPLQPREPIEPAGLASFGSPFSATAGGESEVARRRQLAKWITDPDHPLTMRVLVNRFWQFHFGQGLVSTPSDFGRNGGKPSHPELLDWLASEALNSSPKRLHRLMVASATYRQVSAARPDGMELDAGSRLLWRYPPRRLEAEPLRDAILAVCGNLDDRMGGPGFDLFEPNTNYVKVYNSRHEFGPAEWRRMVYQAKPRMQLDDTFGQFDCPDAGQITPKRTSSITALQALNLLNSNFIVQQSNLFARRLQVEAGDEASRQVRRAFLLTFLREPSADEQAESIGFIQQHGLPAFCRALLNANEFLFVF